MPFLSFCQQKIEFFLFLRLPFHVFLIQNWPCFLMHLHCTILVVTPRCRFRGLEGTVVALEFWHDGAIRLWCRCHSSFRLHTGLSERVHRGKVGERETQQLHKASSTPMPNKALIFGDFVDHQSLQHGNTPKTYLWKTPFTLGGEMILFDLKWVGVRV